MATPPRPRPSKYQRVKKAIDYRLSRIGQALSEPLKASEYEIAPVPTDSICPLPANISMVPANFIGFYKEVFTEVTPNFRQVIYHAQNVYVAWNGTVLKGLRVLVTSLPQPRMEAEFTGTFLLRQLRSHKTLELEAGPVGLAFDSWSGNYFHWIAEVLPRLILLRKQQPNCLVLLPGPTPPEYVTYTVDALGFKNTYVIKPSEVVHVRDLWMPARPGRHGYMVPSLVGEVREAMMSYLHSYLDPSLKATRRIYVSRNRQQWRHLTNEDEVLKMLERYNFKTIYFEDLSFVEQVRTMYETSILIGIHGANMTNLIFMTPGTSVIEMMSETYLNPSYLSMASSIGVSYSVVPSKLGSPLNVEHNYADITADLNLVEQVLCTVISNHC